VTACEESLTQPEAHQALFYRDSDEYVCGILEFINPGLERDEPVAIAVPTPHLKQLRAELGDGAEPIELLDMCELGRNPARIIPAVREMLERHGGKPLRYVGEPIWPGRSAEEIKEATRHEALINLAWPEADISVLCPYDTARLDDQVLLDAEHTHPGFVRDGRLEGSAAYAHGAVPDACEQPLSDPPPGALERAFDADDLRELRTWVGALATGSGLGSDRASELVIAINELTTNTVKHADTHGLLRFWRPPGELIFQIEDAGHIADPLAGRRHQITGTGGLGLWMVNQLCDLVEVRTSRAGTVMRVHTDSASGLSRHVAGQCGLAA
jgi:anti-sigma regulatory factor (Ser/Thr protein kinase)